MRLLTCPSVGVVVAKPVSDERERMLNLNNFLATSTPAHQVVTEPLSPLDQGDISNIVKPLSSKRAQNDAAGTSLPLLSEVGEAPHGVSGSNVQRFRQQGTASYKIFIK